MGEDNLKSLITIYIYVIKLKNNLSIFNLEAIKQKII